MDLDFYGDFSKWDTLIDKLQENEYKLIVLKEKYEEEAQKIIDETDFKEIYGANNQKIRDNHVKKELQALSDDITDLKLQISNDVRRIEFLKHLVRLKTELIRYDGG